MHVTLVPIETRKGDVVEDYHGTQIADPYRWLEDPADLPEPLLLSPVESLQRAGQSPTVPA